MLAEVAQLRSLRILSVDATPITDAGLKHLAALEDLERLYINDTSVTRAGLCSCTIYRNW